MCSSDLALVKPLPDWYLPFTQAVQVLAAPVEYDPLPHVAQAVMPLPLWYAPAAQLPQFVELVKPLPERYVPVPHATQDVTPTPLPYVPEAHLSHAESPLPVEIVPATQLVHAALLENPRPDWYLPLLHVWQTFEPPPP